MTVPVTMLSSIDSVLRDTAVFSVVTDLPGTGVLRQDLDPTAGTLHRVISDVTGIVQDETIPMDHTCLGCAVRADLLRALPEDRPHVVLDLTEVGFMDSAGLHVLFAVQREVNRRDGALAIVAGDAPQVRRLLEVVAPREALPVVATRDAALRHVHDVPPVGVA